MAFPRYLTQKELEAAMQEIVIDEDNNNKSQHIDAVYIPSDVDTLTDEDMNDNKNIQEFGEPTDIVGAFELYTPNDTAVLQQSCNSSTTEQEWDSSDMKEAFWKNSA